MLATLVLLFLFLPAWMQLWPMKPHSLLDGDQPKAEDIALPVRWRKLLARRARTIIAWCLVGLVCVMVFCGIGLTKINTSIKLTKLFSPSAPIIHDYEWLEDKLGPLGADGSHREAWTTRSASMTFLERMELIERIQDQMQKTRRHRQHDVGRDVCSVARGQAQGVPTRCATPSATRSTRSSKTHREEYIDSDFLDIEGDDELWRISARVGALNDIDYGEFKNDIAAGSSRCCRPSGSGSAETCAKKARREARRQRRREAAGRDARRGRRAEHRRSRPDDEHGHRGRVHRPGAGGLQGPARDAQRPGLELRDRLLTIASVMMLVFWDLSAGLILLLPVGVSDGDRVRHHGLAGHRHRRRHDHDADRGPGRVGRRRRALFDLVSPRTDRGQESQRGDHAGLRRLRRAMYQSWAVLGLGLAVFALSSFVPTQRFGAMMFTLLTAALIGNLILLPCVLASPLAYFFGRRLGPQGPRRASRRRAARGFFSGRTTMPPRQTAMPRCRTRSARRFATTARTAFAPDPHGAKRSESTS